MLRKFIIFSFFCIVLIAKSDIEIRNDQPTINVRLFKNDDIKETLESYPCSDDVKTDFQEIIENYSDLKKIDDANISLSKLLFLYGDSRNGDKWTLSRVLAKEMKFSIIRVFPFELLESNVSLHYLVKQLVEAGPCILFIDCFEELLRRSTFYSKFIFQINSAIELIKQLPIIVVCAVNGDQKLRLKNVISEPSIIKEILIPYPDLQSREKILKNYFQDIKLNKEVDLKKVAMLFYGETVFDLLEFANESRLLSLKDNRVEVNLKDVDLAFTKLSFGKNIRYKVTDQERKVTAFHEAGHTLAKILLLKDIDPLYKVTIVSRSAYLGVNCFLSQDKHTYTKDELFNDIQVSLAGTVAERIVFNTTYTGAESDLRHATFLASHLICNSGMSESLVPMIYNPADKIIKKEIQAMMKLAYDKVYKLIYDNKEKLEKIANLLLEKETIFANDVYDLLELKTI